MIWKEQTHEPCKVSSFARDPDVAEVFVGFWGQLMIVFSGVKSCLFGFELLETADEVEEVSFLVEVVELAEVVFFADTALCFICFFHSVLSQMHMHARGRVAVNCLCVDACVCLCSLPCACVRSLLVEEGV